MESWDLDAMGPPFGCGGCRTTAAPSLSLLYLPAVRLSPLHKLGPSNGTRLALVSSELDTPPDLFGDPSGPTSFMDRAIDRLDLVPSLRGHDLW